MAAKIQLIKKMRKNSKLWYNKKQAKNGNTKKNIKNGVKKINKNAKL